LFLEGFLTNTLVIVAITTTTAMVARGTNHLLETAGAIASDWRHEVDARRCAELQALILNMTDAEKVLSRKFPAQRESIAIVASTISEGIASRQVADDDCSWTTLSGLRIKATPRRQNQSGSASPSKPNWAVVLVRNPPTTPHPE